MTSTAVTASAKSFFTGTVTAGTSSGNDVENSFSDILKSQKNDGKVTETENADRTRTESATDRISESGRKNPVRTAEKEEISSEEATEQAEKAAEAAAGQMVTQIAQELGISEEEVMQLLSDLDMTPMDLLDTGNLQTVVLAAAGETDVCSLVTDEQLYTAFKNLKNELTEVIAEVSEATGLKPEEVSEIFDRLMDSAKAEAVQEVSGEETDAQTVQTLQTAQTEDAEAYDLTAEKPEQTVRTDGEETEDGTKLMLERSLAQGAAEDGAKNGANEFFNEAAQNPLMQKLTAVSTDNVMQTVQEAPIFDTDTEMILNQITDYMKGQITDGVSELEMQLHPESLGNLHIRLSAKEGVVTAQFTAQNDTVKAVLESQMIQLKETFKEQGITVEAIEVMVESRKFDQSMSQNSNGMNGENRQGGKQKNRRINLNAFTEEENLTEEDRIAAELLKDSGGTVDYTV